MKDQYTTIQSKQEYVSYRVETTPINEMSPASPALDLAYFDVPFYAQPAGKKIFYDLSKRVFDISFATLFIILALPLFAVIAVLIKLSSPGPVFFRHRRLGLHGKEFDCLKFRTMVTNAEEILKRDPKLQQQFQEKFKIDDDPRITRIGKLLRCTSLDELPQLFHVLQGKMSLIGPRPIIRPELEKYSIYADKLLSVKPGLSGLWQTSGRSNTTYTERVHLDMQYIDYRSLALDFYLLILTVKAVIKKSGAC